MKGRCALTSVGRPTEPTHVSATATESQPEVWMRRDDSSLPGSRVNGSQPGNVIRLAQWPIEEHQRQRHPTPSTPRRSSLDSAHSSTAAGAARVIPLTRWPLSDPRGGRTAIFNAGGTPRRTACTGNRYVSDPCAGRQSSDLKITRKYDNRDDATDVRVLKTNLFSVEGTDWSEEDSICALSDRDRESVTSKSYPSAKSMALLKDIDRFGTNQCPQKDHIMGHSSVNQCPSNVIDSTEADHQRSLKCADLSGEPCPLTDTECTSRAEQRACLQGKRGGEKCARLMSRLCRRQKRSKQHDTTL